MEFKKYRTFQINQYMGQPRAPDRERDYQDEKRQLSASKGCLWAITAVIALFIMPVFVLLAASVTDRVAAAIIGMATNDIGIFAMAAINVNINAHGHRAAAGHSTGGHESENRFKALRLCAGG